LIAIEHGEPFMDVMLVASLIIIIVTVLAIAILAARSPLLFRMAVRNIAKRRKASVLAICGLLVSSAIIAGALAVGDSMENAVVQSAIANLGEVDEVVLSHKTFDQGIHDSMKNDAVLGSMIDGTAPLIILPASVTGGWNNLRESSTLIGFNREFLGFGDFTTSSGSPFAEELDLNEAIINEKLAEGIGANTGDTITLSFRNPDYSIERLFSALSDLSAHNVSQSNLIQHNFTVKEVVKNEGLGRFQLSSKGVIGNNVFVNLTFLQGLLDLDSRINSIVFSNNGDEKEGVELTEDVSQRIETILTEEMGYSDAGFLITATQDYVKMENSDIFFQGRYLNVVESVFANSTLVDAISPMTSYFVNTMVSGTESIYYSTITGFDNLIDSEFGLFTDNATGLEITGDIDDDEIIITNYVADRMGIGVGSNLMLNYSIYSVVQSSLEEEFRFENFTVKYVVEIEGKADDEEIMPPFPGIKGTDSCADWNPPMDSYNISLMDFEDLDYWQQYHGTPKAYITLDKAKELWANDFGNLTTIKIKPTDGTNASLLFNFVDEELNTTIGYKDAGLSLSTIKLDSIRRGADTHRDLHRIRCRGHYRRHGAHCDACGRPRGGAQEGDRHDEGGGLEEGPSGKDICLRGRDTRLDSIIHWNARWNRHCIC
jgi:ABC-type lipoprotein release transport system permease subunit